MLTDSKVDRQEARQVIPQGQFSWGISRSSSEGGTPATVGNKEHCITLNGGQTLGGTFLEREMSGSVNDITEINQQTDE